MSGSDADIQWFIARDGKQHGPVSDLELKKLLELTHLKGTDLVWRQGFTDWRTASSVFPELVAPAAPKAPTQAQPTSTAPASAAPSPSAAPTAKPAATAADQPAASPAPKSPEPQFASFAPAAAQESWRPQNETPRTGQPASRPLGSPTTRAEPAFAAAPGAARPAGIGPGPGPGAGPAPGPNPALTGTIGPGPGPRLTTDSRRPADFAAQTREPTPTPSRGRKFALIAASLLALTGAGAWLSSQYSDEMFSYMLDDGSSDVETSTATANLVPSGSPPQPPPQATPEASPMETAATAAPSVEDIDRRLQGRNMWIAVKQEFPDWYQTRLAEIARLSAQQTDQSEITRYLVSELVTLRRENAKHALAASTPRHKELASAFLANLDTLSKESGDGCYDFISKGESSPTIVARFDDPSRSTQIDAQIVAIVGAIAEGKKQPAEHAAPIKTDYDVLAGELGRLGWTQADMQLFANPKALAQAPRSRVCNMLKDWFTAHLAIQDPSTQERLLFETLKPVISG
ncbi:DUF4339 domain-containing protein [Hyphomicrobium sp. CS1GBMeth3]|uniref:DUF4339 domain-containing protein n=1 Tax=Hyphomicrobium sp. CS1GBMeth3 TaxID=1892845 RepID=UPI000931D4EE|nr:DUF4339 domain-containing protein [Hyphomicrobium sp. CS1GBMeth3]